MPNDTAGYAGDVSPEEAWGLLATEPKAVLVDVRTQAEWTFVGIPLLAALDKEPLFLEWQVYPGMEVRGDFAELLAAHLRKQGLDSDSPVLFLCRSGARSRSAAIALTKSGFSRAYNVAGGFEGPADPDSHRGSVAGWKASGLPWVQG